MRTSDFIRACRGQRLHYGAFGQGEGGGRLGLGALDRFCSGGWRLDVRETLLAFIGFKRGHESVKFILCRPPVSFYSLPHEIKFYERDARQFPPSLSSKHAVDGGSVR